MWHNEYNSFKWRMNINIHQAVAAFKNIVDTASREDITLASLSEWNERCS